MSFSPVRRWSALALVTAAAAVALPPTLRAADQKKPDPKSTPKTATAKPDKPQKKQTGG